MGRGDDKSDTPRVARGKLIAGDREIHLTRLEELILWCLAARNPKPTTLDDMVYFVYGDREDGGPLWAESIVKVKITSLRKKLRNIGWGIYAPSNYGYRIRQTTAASKHNRRRP